MADGENVLAVSSRVSVADTIGNRPGAVDVVGELSGHNAGRTGGGTSILGVGVTNGDFETSDDFLEGAAEVEGHSGVATSSSGGYADGGIGRESDLLEDVAEAEGGVAVSAASRGQGGENVRVAQEVLDSEIVVLALTGDSGAVVGETSRSGSSGLSRGSSSEGRDGDDR